MNGLLLIVKTPPMTDDPIRILLPQPVAHHRDFGAPGRSSAPSNRGPRMRDAERREVVSGDEFARIALGRLRAACPPDAQAVSAR